MPQKKTRKNKKNHKHFYSTPTPYPVSPSGHISGIVSSSSAVMKAVSRDGKHWHVDADINGAKKHANLTNSQIMDILAYPAAKQDLRTHLIQKLRDISPHHGCSNKPILINKLPPLHEARIIPEMNGEPIHLIPNPVQSYNDSGLSSIRKAKKKGKGKGGGKTVNKKGKR